MVVTFHMTLTRKFVCITTHDLSRDVQLVISLYWNMVRRLWCAGNAACFWHCSIWVSDVVASCWLFLVTVILFFML
uniref:Uncharacterized protein n=1 Tax=Hordeum vulgare subsp. vulgare TaxID=112509 RepID=A0A8I6Y519_HORVV